MEVNARIATLPPFEEQQSIQCLKVLPVDFEITQISIVEQNCVTVIAENQPIDTMDLM